MSVLESAPKPLTSEAALSLAKDYLIKNNKHQEYAQFETWFNRNGDTLLEKINNG
jgi:hypothetical protein